MGKRGASRTTLNKMLGIIALFGLIIVVTRVQWQQFRRATIDSDKDILLHAQNQTIVTLAEALAHHAQQRPKSHDYEQLSPIRNVVIPPASEQIFAKTVSTRISNVSWSPLQLSKEDWVVYLRIQKTGSQTLWLTLVDVFDGSVWGSPRCQKGVFCGYMCESVLMNAFLEVRRQRKCQLFVRAHAGIRDFKAAAAKLPVNFVQRFRWLAFLREPIARARSEYEHITNGLVAQFGPHVFGKAWDYGLTNRNQATLDHWIQCKQCQVGASNRQTRFLAGLAPTGILETNVQNENLLRAAILNLEQCDFVGVLDHFSDAMFLLRETLPTHLKRFTSYSLSLHPKGHSVKVTPSKETLAKLTALNTLDTKLYAHAISIFQQRWNIMLNSIPSDRRHLRFRPVAGGRVRQQRHVLK